MCIEYKFINTNKRIRIFSAERYLSCLVEYPDPVASWEFKLNHVGSRTKQSCLRIYGELVCKEVSRSFYNFIVTYDCYMLCSSR